MSKKLGADKRTISFLDGKTEQEKIDETERIRQNLDLQTNEERPPAETIEQAADRWRAQAFVGQEWLTKHFNDPDATSNQYRVTNHKGWLYLEQMKVTCTGKEKGPAYGYAGVMFPEEDIYALAEVLVAAAREKKRGNVHR